MSNPKQTPQPSKNRACPCGSGKKYKRCCGLKENGAIPGAQDRNPHLPDTEQVLRALVREQPNAVEPLRKLIQLLKNRFASDAEIVDLQKQLVLLTREDYDDLCETARTLLNLNRAEEAEICARRAVGFFPNRAQAHQLLGEALSLGRDYAIAEFHYKQALWLALPTSRICANLARALGEQGKVDEAIAFYKQSLALEPGRATELLSWAKQEESRGNFAEAWALVGQAKKLVSARDSVIMETILLRREGRLDEAIAKLDETVVAGESASFLLLYYRERGAILDEMGRYDEAFEAFENFNAAISRTRNTAYDSSRNRKLFDRYRACFTTQTMAALPKCGGADVPSGQALPLFIVGYPRSGTTLVEQILSSHPNISAGDELSYIGRLVDSSAHFLGARSDYPEFLTKLGREELARGLRALREYYLCNALADEVIGAETRRFTDKMPLNEMHLGFINLIFNEAPIVHVIRHPLDVVLSTYFTDLSHGDNASFRLESAARHYAMVFDLVQHYRENLDMRYHQVRYEDLVENPDQHIRSLLEFVGEEWDDRCLQFHRNTRVARTASYAQVTKKLYRSSLFRYRNYKKHLDLIIPLLEPAITSLEYTID